MAWMDDMGFSIFDEPREVAFAHLLKTPDPKLLGEESDVSTGQIYRLLFAVAADAEFLRDGRLLTWALDLATASAAAIAMCLAGSLDARPRREQVVLNALDALFFGELVDGEAPVSRANLWGGNVEEALRAAMNVVRADWSCSGTEMFNAARRAYVGEMAALGVSLADIRRVRGGSVPLNTRQQLLKWMGCGFVCRGAGLSPAAASLATNASRGG